MMKKNLSSCHNDTLILHQLHQQHYNLLALLYIGRYMIQMYDGIRKFCYPDSANVDCTRWLPSPKTISKIKRLFSELPTVSQYNTLTLYDGTVCVVTFANQCNPNKNINFVCHQSHFKIISDTVFIVVLQQFYNKN